MTNSEIAHHFSLLSKLMDIHGADPFRAKSYATLAFQIENLPEPLADLPDESLFSLKGVGERMGKKIRELQQTGTLQPLEDLLSETPPGVLEMLRIKGIGPKKIHLIWKQLGVESPGELEYACEENRLLTLKGFGAKTQATVLDNLRYHRQSQGFRLWSEAHLLSDILLSALRVQFPGELFAVTGSLRRQNEVISSVEMVTTVTKKDLIGHFAGEVIHSIEEQEDRLVVDTGEHLPIYFYCCKEEDFNRTLFSTTGSEDFISAFDSQYPVNKVQSEEEIFSENGLQFIPPALREHKAVLKKAKKNLLPEFIRDSDIKGIIHSHSVWSDGLDTIAVMAEAAKEQGFEYLVISDHSQSAFYAQGLTPQRLAAQHQEIDALNLQLAPFKIFKSIESDILYDGSLDYATEVLATFDLVIASVHSNLKMSEDRAMSRLLEAVQHPFTSILGHLTGRLLLSRKGYPVDHKTIIEACAAHQVVIEINANPRRLDMDWRWVEYAMQQGVLLSVNPDAHSVAAFRDIYYGIKSAQKGGLTSSSNLSSFSLKEFEAFLKKQQKKRKASSE